MEPPIPKIALQAVQQDAPYSPTKKDYASMQAYLRFIIPRFISSLSGQEKAEEVLDEMLTENPKFVAMLYYMTEEGVKKHMAPSRQEVWLDAIRGEKALNEMLRMRDMGNPIHFVEIN